MKKNIYKEISKLMLIAGFFLATIQVQAQKCTDTKAVTIVVLGSSSAAGFGPSDPDSAWVNRYTAYLKSKNSQNKVYNLARGGYTTYHVMPDAFNAPAERPEADTLRNITKAFDFKPDAIIINLPSNDVAQRYNNTEILANFDSLFNHAKNNNVLIWITSMQPKKFAGQVQTDQQIELKNAIHEKYKEYALDFWTSIAAEDGTIKAEYDYGDGTHLNDAGHAILESRVEARDLLDAICRKRNPGQYPTFSVEENSKILFNVYPNPAGNHIVISSDQNQMAGEVSIESINGQVLMKQTCEGKTLNIDLSALQMKTGVYLIKINTGSSKHVLKFIKQ